MNSMSFYSYFFGLLLFLFSITPLFIYLIFGRAPKIDYNMEYETDLPTGDPPAIVNAICSGTPENVGVANLDGLRATILDMIDRNYLLITNEENNQDLLLEINDYDPLSLWMFERMVLDFLKRYEQNGVISMNFVSENIGHNYSMLFSPFLKIGNKSLPNSILDEKNFKSFFKRWRNAVFDGFLEYVNVEDMVTDKGHVFLKVFGYAGPILAIIFIELYTVHNSDFILADGIILAASSFIALLIPKKFVGTWTPYGREYYEMWMSFRRYVTDFSLIEDYSPKSVKLWRSYMIYGTALGAAKGVNKSMKMPFLYDGRKDGEEDYFYDAFNIFGY